MSLPHILISDADKLLTIVCKFLLLVFVLVFAYFFYLRNPFIQLVSVILLISVGVLLMVETETYFLVASFLYCQEVLIHLVSL